MTENLPEITAPIDERIYSLVCDMDSFNFKTIRSLFPNESDKTLYRALNKLESSGRIRFLFWNQKMKHYTGAGVSKLPIFSRPTGNFNLADILRGIADHTDEYGRPKALANFDDYFINMAQFLLIVDAETDKELKDNYLTLHHNLTEMRRKLMIMVSDIDAILGHATMRGDLEYFKRVFTSGEAPTAEEKLTFKRWLTAIYNNRKAMNVDF